MENFIVKQIPMTFDHPVSEDVSGAPDAKALSRCPYYDRDVFNDRNAYYRIYYHLGELLALSVVINSNTLC
jgi:hypothetical protein